MNQSLVISCPICKGTHFQHFLDCADFTASHELFSLKQCTSCQFVFTEPKPDKDTISKYYLSENYISHTGANKSFFDKIYLRVRDLTLKWKRRIIGRNSTGKTLLDIGCGTGEFIKEMNAHGWDITGVEPSALARTAAEKNAGIKIKESYSELENNTYDVISLWHVLEHLHDLHEALKKFQSLLKKSGTIFIAVPNFQSFDAQHYNSYWAGYDVPRHLWHFGKENMKMLLENNGFKLVKILPMQLDSFYVSLLSESYKNPNRWKLINLINAVTTGLKSNLMARNSLNHSSLIYIAKR